MFEYFFLLEIKTTNNAETENVSYNSALRSFRTNDSHLFTASPFFLVSDGGREGGTSLDSKNSSISSSGLMPT